MKFYDAFHGVGGFRYGLEQAGMECVGGCEIDRFACQAYGVINDEDCQPTDIRTVDPIRLPDFDVFVGGFPCQDLSVAGKRKGFDGSRSVLFFEILRICEIKRPTYILLENVTGLFSHNGGETFGIVLKSLDELGYDAEWQVHNSAAYVPQNRERVFIVGHLRERSTRPVFPFGAENGGHAKQFSQGEGFAYYIDTGYPKGISENYMDKARRTMILEPIAVLTPDREEKRQDGRIFKEPGEPMFTLTAQDKHGVAIKKIGHVGNKETQNNRVHDITGLMPTLWANGQGGMNPGGLILDDRNQYRIRKLTPLECFRLQGYPDWWLHKCNEAGISDSQLYKMAGNGVSSPVAKAIGLRF